MGRVPNVVREELMDRGGHSGERETDLGLIQRVNVPSMIDYLSDVILNQYKINSIISPARFRQN